MVNEEVWRFYAKKGNKEYPIAVKQGTDLILDKDTPEDLLEMITLKIEDLQDNKKYSATYKKEEKKDIFGYACNSTEEFSIPQQKAFLEKEHMKKVVEFVSVFSKTYARDLISQMPENLPETYNRVK